MANQSEFLNNQQALAYHVARLPLLRRDLEQTNEQVKQGYLGNNAAQREAYNHCAGAIKQLAAAL